MRDTNEELYKVAITTSLGLGLNELNPGGKAEKSDLNQTG